MKKGILLLLLSLLSACGGDNNSSQNPTPQPENPDTPVAGLTIPVVVHVMEHPASDDSRISVAKVHSQIAALNRAFNRQNDDLSQVPAEFQPFIADMQNRFELATTDPQGQPTTGITRTTQNIELAPEEYRWGYRYLHYSALGGKDPWPRERYLNIWVSDMRNHHGRVGLAGRASLPGDPAEEDGVLIATLAFGTEPPLEQGLHLGKTTAHEVGHWLGLKHIAGEQESCNVDDGISDTPLSSSNYGGLNPSHPSSTCDSADMFMNYMSLARDESLLMFSQGQKAAVWSVLEEGGVRHSLLLNSRNAYAQ